MLGEHDVGGDICCGVYVVGGGAGGFGVEVAYGVGRLVELLLADAERLADVLVAVVGEVVEVVLHDVEGHGLVGCAAQLQCKALLQVACPDARRVEALHRLEGLLYLLVRGFDALSEGEVVGYEVEAAAQVAGIVERAYDLGGDSQDPAVEAREGELLQQSLGKGTGVAHHEVAAGGVGVLLEVLAVVVVEALVLVVVVVPVRLCGVGARQRLFVGRFGVEQGVLLYLFFDGLFQVGDRQLQQSHQLYLLRRELLLQLLSLYLFHLTMSISSMRFLAPA